MYDQSYRRTALLHHEQGIDAKVVVMGNTSVGKTSLLQRYTQGKFDPKNTTSTTGAFFVSKKVFVDGIKVRLQLWDTAGQERFRSMAPMYYRGANAAIVMYDITNAATFDDIRGWLEELKKNCGPELIIYIVGSKADLHNYRAVSSDLARLSLHTWFPPPRPPTPPPPPPPLPSLYIRPRFTSFPTLRSPTVTSPSPQHSSPDTSPYLDLHTTRPSALSRNKTTSITQRTGGALSPALVRSHTTASKQTQSSRFKYFGFRATAWNETSGETSSNSIEEETDDQLDQDERDGHEEWGLSKGMQLFEVSAKDDVGVQDLFDTLISTIITRKDTIEEENELKKRDSVFLSSITPPDWNAQAEEEEARVNAEQSRSKGWASSCC